ncbi:MULTISPECIES: putative quinol monooxygenase [unclassified Mameliella]|uniref:putative quinol monooxygenase n=1 Tax=unclassified Mameliella TaxID=2630630 RepID=UPI00273D9752|nr:MULTISPECIES: putative quinol monooxygenase [unclassified Mameliella]
MYAVTVTFTLHPGTRAEFLPLMTENARLSLANEPGCLQFDVCCNDAADEVFLYEVYDSAEAFDVHLQSPHFKSFDAAVADMIAAKTVRTYTQVIR